MLIETLAGARELGRVNDIVGVLIRWGLGDAVRRLGLDAELHMATEALPLMRAGWRSGHARNTDDD